MTQLSVKLPTMRKLLLFLLLIPSLSFAEQTEKAIFAGGCFWCVQSLFDPVDGVTKTIAGYTGGSKDKPTYHDLSSGETSHVEAVTVEFNPEKVSYEKLVDIFWKNIDPFDSEGQFCDKGEQYKQGIFYLDDKQKGIAEKSLEDMKKKFTKPIYVFVKKASEFFPAEEYHQGYYKKNPLKYKMYRTGCQRDARLEEVWGTESKH